MNIFDKFNKDIKRLILVELENNIKDFVSLIDGYFPEDDYIWEMIFIKAFGEKNPIDKPTRDEYLKVKAMESQQRKEYAEKYHMNIFQRKIYYSERLFNLPYLSEVKIFLGLGADIHVITEVSFKGTITYMTYYDFVKSTDYKKDILQYIEENGFNLQ
jgi:hypothetical protein